MSALPILEDSNGTFLHNSEVVVEYAVNQAPGGQPEGSEVTRFMLKKRISRLEKGLPEIFAKLTHTSQSYSSETGYVVTLEP